MIILISHTAYIQNGINTAAKNTRGQIFFSLSEVFMALILLNYWGFFVYVNENQWKETILFFQNDSEMYETVN